MDCPTPPMEVYLQEIASTVYFPQLPSALKARVLQLASAFPGTGTNGTVCSDQSSTTILA